MKYVAVVYEHPNGPMLFDVLATDTPKKEKELVRKSVERTVPDLGAGLEELLEVGEFETFTIPECVGKVLAKHFDRYKILEGFEECEQTALSEFGAHHSLLWLLKLVRVSGAEAEELPEVLVDSNETLREVAGNRMKELEEE